MPAVVTEAEEAAAEAPAVAVNEVAVRAATEGHAANEVRAALESAV
ncbi:hypothetical protein K788_0007194 [Paraburkholderia caribensis MBA4]|uniref:Uncharacterized protein n=1 Tax=Paraburkholderia caribensis MBA4 TaxID=1323664 RepID=A0A0P0R6X5_9BURK|nr:hypothetical protein K788_0007194 [Paraburkholderia caribensis MBA4]